MRHQIPQTHVPSGEQPEWPLKASHLGESPQLKTGDRSREEGQPSAIGGLDLSHGLDLHGATLNYF